MSRGDDGIRGDLVADPTRFSTESLERVAAAFTALLGDAAAQRDLVLSQLPGSPLEP
ncbi:hypothetical protein [Streptomyces sp. NPDC016172]|uniref:hypothetical protein n=1 Tax=Streptomyces sp. NPDC016172 TaxID=3364964 RepID=UPI003702A12F